MIRTCPVCRIGLVDQKFDGVNFAECPQCAGVWILEEELKRLESVGVDELKRLDAMERPMSVPPPPASSVFACPSCGGAMEQFHFLYNTPIMLHRCQPCGGLWIEDGEMAQMATMIEQGDSVGTNLGVEQGESRRDHGSIHARARRDDGEVPIRRECLPGPLLLGQTVWFLVVRHTERAKKRLTIGNSRLSYKRGSSLSAGVGIGIRRSLIGVGVANRVRHPSKLCPLEM